MIWRLHAEIFFVANNRRSQFLGAWDAWKQGKVVLIEEVLSLDEDGGDPEGTPPIPAVPLPYPLVRMDVVFEDDQVTLDSLDQVRAIDAQRTVYVRASLHRCAVGTSPNPLPDGPVEHYERGTNPL